MDESSLDLFVPPDSRHPSFFESSDERGVEGRTVVTDMNITFNKLKLMDNKKFKTPLALLLLIKTKYKTCR